MILLLVYFLNKKIKISEMMNIIFSYPTQAEIYKMGAVMDVKDRFKDWHRMVISKVFRFR